MPSMFTLRLLPALAFGLIGCGPGGSGSSGAPASSHADWRTTGPFAAKRAALKTAVETFPANVSSVPRCAPGGQKGIFTLGYNIAQMLYAPKAPAAPKVGEAVDIDVASYRFLLESIERATWETAPPQDKERWSKPPLDWVTAVALFRAESVTPPTSALCSNTSAGQNCQMIVGVVEGDLVVFDDQGKPTCANRLRIEGPSSALIKVGDKLADLQRIGVETILQHYFYFATETVPEPAPWRFLNIHQSGTSPSGLYSISVDGQRVQTATSKL
jgi:hypothetical protein